MLVEGAGSGGSGAARTAWPRVTSIDERSCSSADQRSANSSHPSEVAESVFTRMRRDCRYSSSCRWRLSWIGERVRMLCASWIQPPSPALKTYAVVWPRCAAWHTASSDASTFCGEIWSASSDSNLSTRELIAASLRLPRESRNAKSPGRRGLGKRAAGRVHGKDVGARVVLGAPARRGGHEELGAALQQPLLDDGGELAVEQLAHLSDQTHAARTRG